MNVNLPILILLVALLSGRVNAALQLAPITSKPSDVLLLLDGSILHGQLDLVEPGKALVWNYPDALQPLRLRPNNIERIRFSKPRLATNQTAGLCRFRFQNGDEIFGKAISLEGSELEIETTIAGRITADKNSITSMAFLSKGLSTLYEGPNGIHEWVLAKTPNTWHYRDGTLMANGPGVIGRDMKLTGSSSIQFDLGWSGQFNMILVLYTDSLDRFDYSSHCYVFYLGAGYVNAQRVQGGVGAMNLGHAQIPAMTRKNKMKVEIRANKEDSSLALYADGALIQKWRDTSGFVASGSGVVFSSNIGAPRISNIRVSDWDTKIDPETGTNAPAGPQDTVFLVNRDKVAGKVEAFKDGKIKLVAGETSLEIPIERVTQVAFSHAEPAKASEEPWDVRATFAGGGAVTFRLEEWGKALVGTSKWLGKVSFSPEALQQIQFNLARSRMASGVSDLNEQSNLDFYE